MTDKVQKMKDLLDLIANQGNTGNNNTDDHFLEGKVPLPSCCSILVNKSHSLPNI